MNYFYLCSEMNNQLVYIALGSNVITAPRVLEWARRKLRAAFGSSCRFSEPVWTEPIDYPYPFPFLNQVMQLSTARPLIALEVLLKAMEEEMMRRRSTAGEGRRIIDIGLLSYGETVLRPDDWNRQYIQDGISALSANTGRKR